MIEKGVYDRSTVQITAADVMHPQQSLLSWAEFMVEGTVKPNCRNRKTQPATASLFDWALTLEQEREKEFVGAGR